MLCAHCGGALQSTKDARPVPLVHQFLRSAHSPQGGSFRLHLLGLSEGKPTSGGVESVPGSRRPVRRSSGAAIASPVLLVSPVFGLAPTFCCLPVTLTMADSTGQGNTWWIERCR